jgi:hypothetical protein
MTQPDLDITGEEPVEAQRGQSKGGSGGVSLGPE